MITMTSTIVPIPMYMAFSFVAGVWDFPRRRCPKHDARSVVRATAPDQPSRRPLGGGVGRAGSGLGVSGWGTLIGGISKI
jgi:hypothetical protein